MTQSAQSISAAGMPSVALRCDRAGCLLEVGPGWPALLGWAAAESRGRLLAEFLFDDASREAWRSLLAGPPAANPHPAILPLMFAHQSGAPVAIALAATVSADSIHGTLAAMPAAVQARDDWFALQHLPQQLNLCRNTHDVCLTVAREARRLFGHDALAINHVDLQEMVSFVLFEEDTPPGAPGPVILWPIPEEEARPTPLNSAQCLEEAVLVNRPAADKPAPDEPVALKPFGHKARRSLSLMFAPIRLEGRVVGQLTVQSYAPNRYNPTDLALLQNFADQCGAALARTSAVEALFRSESIFREVIERADAVPYKLELQSMEYEHIGHKAPALLGIPAEQLDHAALRSIILEAIVADPAWEGDDRSYVKAFEEGRVTQYLAELHIKTPQGDEKWLSDTAVPVRDRLTGRVAASLGILQDITERKRAEQRLRQSEATKSALLHAIPDMMLIIDRSGVIQEYMPARTFSLPDPGGAGLAGRPLREVMPELSAYLDPAFCEIVLTEGQMRLEEMSLVFSEGMLDVELRIIPCQADSILVILRDISKRKRAEQERQALKRLSQRLTGSLTSGKISAILAEESRRLFRHDAFAIMMLDKENRVVRYLHLEDTPLGSTLPQSMPPRPPRPLDPGESFAGQPRLINRESPSDAHPLRPFGDTRRVSMSLMFAPILWEDEVVGLMTVQSYKPRFYTERHLELLAAFASQCGAALLRAEAEERLHRTAYYDPLTGLPNRALLLEVLHKAMLEVRQRPNRLLFVLYIDLDRFKNINDSLGYQLGDELLLAVARRLTSVIGEQDMAARIGSDDFIVLTHSMGDPLDIDQFTQRILAEINRPIQIRSHEVLVSACVGIAPCSLSHDSADNLLHDAEAAMYMAKKHGRSCHSFFDYNLHAKSVASIRLESDLAAAVQRGELEMHYQPIFDLLTGRAVALEALIRWRHSAFGMVMPGDFISIAEDTGLIYSLGEWGLREACAAMAAWRQSTADFHQITLSVNVSPRQFVHPRFPQLIERILDETNLPPASLNIEITETALLQGADQTNQLFHSLKNLGLNLHLDDFGTGYCSLSYLHQIPINALKIDQSFISGIHANDDKLQITRSILALAGMLNLMVIAEGVEIEAQRETLLRLGCRYAQGTLLCEPLARDEVEKFIVSRNPLPR